MKIALYIEDGQEQIVLTPETDTEKGILGKLHDGSREFDLKRGSFYACQGGWTRHAAQSWTSASYGPSESRDDDSTMIVLRAPQPKEKNND
ncbi:MAG TPA: hypothetical protein DF966_18295 [Sulfitobacter sp.]|nr:hypothetical protein [Sulfitobacter sp.]